VLFIHSWRRFLLFSSSSSLRFVNVSRNSGQRGGRWTWLCGDLMPHFRFEDLPNFRIFFFVQRGSTKSGSLPTSREKNSEKWWNWWKLSQSFQNKHFVKLIRFFFLFLRFFFLKVDFANVPFKPFVNNLFFYLCFFYVILFHFCLFYGLFFVFFKLSLAMINAHNVFFCFVH